MRWQHWRWPEEGLALARVTRRGGSPQGQVDLWSVGGGVVERHPVVGAVAGRIVVGLVLARRPFDRARWLGTSRSVLE